MAVIVVDLPRMFERPRCAVLAFMAGLSMASGRNARCYVDELMTALCDGAGAEA